MAHVLLTYIKMNLHYCVLLNISLIAELFLFLVYVGLDIALTVNLYSLWPFLLCGSHFEFLSEQLEHWLLESNTT